MKSQLYKFLINSQNRMAELHFDWEKSDACWLGISGLQFPLRFSINMIKIGFKKSFIADDVLNIIVYPASFSKFELTMKKSLLLNSLKLSPFNEISFDERYFNVLDDSKVYDPILRIQEDSINITYKITHNNYFVNLNGFESIKFIDD